jgi:hypothetical protein
METYVAEPSAKPKKIYVTIEQVVYEKPFQRLLVNLLVTFGFIRGVCCGRNSESG